MKKNPKLLSDKVNRGAQRVIMVKTIEGHLLNGMDDGKFQARLVNISSTGAQIYSHKIIENRAGISLTLDSLDGVQTIAFTGKVVWTRKNAMKSMGRYAYGIQFIKLSQEQTKFLETNFAMDPSAIKI